VPSEWFDEGWQAFEEACLGADGQSLKVGIWAKIMAVSSSGRTRLVDVGAYARRLELGYTYYEKAWPFLGPTLRENREKWELEFKRRLLRSTIRRARRKRRNPNVKAWAQPRVTRRILGNMGKIVVSAVRQTVLELKPPPSLEESTVKRKGHDTLLIDKMNLLNNIAYKVNNVEP